MGLIKENEYQCAACGGIFEKGRSDDEARAEANAIWGFIPEEEQIVICDDCYNNRTSDEIKAKGDEYKAGKEIK